MKAILRGEHLDYETYNFIRECGIKAIVLLKFDLTVGPYIAFKSVYDQHVPAIEALENPEYLAQFYVGISGTELDEIAKNGERIIVTRQTHDMDANHYTDVLLLCIDKDVSTPAVIKLANELLKNASTEPHFLEEAIAQLKETAPNLKLQLKRALERKPIELQNLENVPKKHKFVQSMQFATPFAFLQKREINEIELRFPTLRKGMYFIRMSLESLDIPRFFDIFLSNMIMEKNTTFSIDLRKRYAVFDLGLTLFLPPNQRNFVERLAGALTMAEFSISIVRGKELENHWVAPLGIMKGTTLRISRKHKDFIQVLSSPPLVISLFRSKTIQPLTLFTLMQALESTHATILCRGIGKNKVEVEIVLTKIKSADAELDQLSIPHALAEYFKRIRGRRNMAHAIETLLLRHCSKGTRFSLHELKEFFEGEVTRERISPEEQNLSL